MSKRKLTFSDKWLKDTLKANDQIHTDQELTKSESPLAKILKMKSKTVDGMVFDSILEARRYGVLKLWQKARLISDLSTQHEDIGKTECDARKHWWLLTPAYTNKRGKSIRAQYYVDDFQYRIGDVWIVEDIKGFARRTFINKMKVLETKYPDINFFLNYKEDGWFYETTYRQI